MDKFLLTLAYYLFPIILTYAGIQGAYNSIRKLRGDKTKKNWNRTDGIVTNTEIIQKEWKNPAGKIINLSYYPSITYSYQVGDKTYTGNKYTADNLGKERGLDYLKKFPLGKIFPVLYNPNAPHEVISVKELKSSSILLILSIFVIIIGISGSILQLYQWIASP